MQVAFEIIIALAVVGIQLFFFFTSYGKIKLLSSLLPKGKLDESFLQTSDTVNGDIQLIKTDANTFSKDFTETIDSINKYLLKNQGATDFSIIKSIVERSIETKENSVAANVTLPLYIGLMGTFTGIILGLLKIAFFGGVTEENINSFIGGVVIAMVASFFGLLLTVINNSKNYKEAKAICDGRKNSFYNFLQVELLPHLGNSLFDALDRLKDNINDFNKKFENNIDLFDNKFSTNISSLSESVSSLSKNIGAVVENTDTQKAFLIELKKIGYNRLAEANMKVFTLIKDTTPTLIEFVEKQKQLTILVQNTGAFVTTIENVLNRIKTFEESINRLGENINTKQYLSGQIIERLDKNLNLLDRQFEILKNHEIQSSDTIEDFFKKQIFKIQTLTDNVYKNIEDLTTNIHKEVKSSFDLNNENNPLHNLQLLEAISNKLDTITGIMDQQKELSNIEKNIKDGILSVDEFSKIKETIIIGSQINVDDQKASLQLGKFDVNSNSEKVEVSIDQAKQYVGAELINQNMVEKNIEKEKQNAEEPIETAADIKVLSDQIENENLPTHPLDDLVPEEKHWLFKRFKKFFD